MAYDIRLIKLVSSEMIIGKYKEEDGKKTLTDAAVVQTVPTQQGVQMMLLPFGYPFDNDIDAEISYDFAIYEYKNVPEEMKTKYLEAASGLDLSASGGMGGLGAGGGLGGGQGGVSDISQLLKK